jgi:NAD(P)-dependent dehydrogenase (short-subunit alcohol dehydrogenase family)
VALVTGAGRGIGRAIAVALGDAGASIAICDKSEEEVATTAKAVRARGGIALAVPADVPDLGEVERMVTEVEAEMGPVDLLVNNAGVHGPVAPLVESGPDEWWQTMEVNVRGLLYCSLAVLGGMVERGHGRIVNLASGLGFVASPRLSSYCVSEAALLRLTESLAVEVRDHGVHAFAVVAGLVPTAVGEDGAPRRAPGTAEDLQALFERGADVLPQRAAGLVVRIASGEADALSGRYIEVPNPLAPTREDLAGTVARAKEIIERDLFVLRDRE